MFIRKPKFVDGWSVTRNPNKFDGDVIFALGPTKEDKKLGEWFVKEQVAIRLDKDAARGLCDIIMGYFDE